MTQAIFSFKNFPPVKREDVEYVISDRLGSNHVIKGSYDLPREWRDWQLAKRMGCDIQQIRNATNREVRDYEREFIEERYVQVVGENAFQEIMNMPTPMEIVRLILVSQRTNFPLPLMTITNEVKAGTVDYLDCFESFGVKRPSEIDEATQERKLIIEQYDKLLDSFSEHICDPREGIIMISAENILLELVKENFTKIINVDSDVICVAAAGTIANINVIINSLSAVSPQSKKSNGIFASESERAISDRAIEQASIWAYDNLGPIHLRIIRKIKGEKLQSQDDLKRQIKAIVQIYRNMNKYANKSV